MSSSIAAICSAIDASATVRGSRAGSGRPLSDVEEAIAIPPVEEFHGFAFDRSARKLACVREASQRGPGACKRAERIAVDEEMTGIVEQLGAAVQAQTALRDTRRERWQG